MTIGKIGPGKPTTATIGETIPAEKTGNVSGAAKTGFAQIPEASISETKPDHLADFIFQISSKIAAGQMTRQQAIDLILFEYRKEILAATQDPARVEGTIEFIREVINGDPLLDSLLPEKSEKSKF